MKNVSLFVAALVAATTVVPSERSPQQEARCVPARQFLEERGFTAVTEPDVIDDWRSQSVLSGCRVTAARITSRELSEEVLWFYEELRQAGWNRTPDPVDAPNEASLRFRLDETDCLFNVYSLAMLGTEAERVVSLAQVPEAGARRYYVLVLCKPAVDAAHNSGAGHPEMA